MIYTTTSRIEVVPCARCGVEFGIVADWLDRRRADGKTFCCPDGHGNSYRDTTIDRLKRRVRLLENEETELRRTVKRSKRDATTARAATTRAKNRTKKGVCLYCNRTVKQMAKHVENKHPDKVEAKS